MMVGIFIAGSIVSTNTSSVVSLKTWIGGAFVQRLLENALVGLLLFNYSFVLLNWKKMKSGSNTRDSKESGKDSQDLGLQLQPVREDNKKQDHDRISNDTTS